MGIYDRVKKLCKDNKITISALEKELGWSRGAMCKIDKHVPNGERLLNLANYFGVTPSYLLGEEEITAKDERDIAKDLENIRRKLQTGEEGVASFEGVDIPPEDQELFLGQVELMLKRLKAINKVKYNPHKNGN